MILGLKGLMRGPAREGKGRWSDFDIKSFNIPIPSLDTISRDKGKSYTPRSGIIKQFLQGFIKMAMAHAQPIAENGLVKTIPVVRSIDGFGLKAGCQRDQIINELIGATQKIDIEYVIANPNPDPAKLRDLLVKEAELKVLTTLNCRTTLPVGANYIGERNGEVTYNDVKLRVKEIHHDLSCSRDNGDLCNSFCALRSEQNSPCVNRSEKGYTNIDPSLTPCSRCMDKEMQCRKLVVIFCFSD